ncbi:ABC transporter permease [Agromyces archimandritae]|uniref:Iron ABC transporter permease n=1 Tax=Agromyces archimandritae TaxID=2781962 RepID=A0A975FM21_9MICO|nr:iron ABC transporter permease [Agromyces archimandritae]QTX04406.1 iron ABC transporter permease [Agromyces archimandritae]
MTSVDIASDRRASRTRAVVRRALWSVFVIGLGLLFVFPVSMIVLGAVRDGLPTAPDVRWTLDGMVAALTQSATWTTLLNSLILVVVCGAVATTMGALFAWIRTNTDVPLRRALTPLMIINLFVPPLFYTFGWIMLGNAQNGLINQWARSLFGTQQFVDVQSWGGLILTMSLGYIPFAYLLMQGAFLNRDQSLDEAASIAGARTWRTFLTVTLPSVGPALTGAATLIMVLILQSFESPYLLGRPADIHVFSTQIYHYIRDTTPAEYTSAFTLALIVVLLVVLLFGLQRRLLRGRSFTTLTGKSSRRDPLQLGPVRWLFTVLICVFLLLNLVLPLGAVFLGSLQPTFGVMRNLSFDNYTRILADPMLRESLELTAWISVAGGFVAMAVALLTSYVVLRRRGFLRGYTSFAMWIPWALPGIVLALAYMFAVLAFPGVKGLYGTPLLMGLVLVVATVPLCGRLAEGALAQLAPELEEAGRISGAGPVRVLGTIVLRLLIPSFLSGWFLAALFISGNLAIPTLLAPPGFQPVAVAALTLYLNGDFSTAAALFMIILFAAAIVLALAGATMWSGRRLGARRTEAAGLHG